MGFYFEWGGYSTADCTAKPLSRVVQSVELGGRILSNIVTQQVEVTIYGTDPSDLSASMLNLEANKSITDVDGGVVWLKNAVSTDTRHYLYATGAISPTQIVSIAWSSTDLTLAREVVATVTLRGEYPVTSPEIVSLIETVSIVGDGGPVTVLVPQENAVSVYDQLSPYSDLSVQQSGTIVTRTSFGTDPPLMVVDPDAKVSRQTRNVLSVIQKAGVVSGYQRQYSFTFIIPSALGAFPTPNFG